MAGAYGRACEAPRSSRESRQASTAHRDQPPRIVTLPAVAFGADVRRRDPGRHGAVGCHVHERVRATDEHVPRRARQEGQDLGDHRASTRRPWSPARRGASRVRARASAKPSRRPCSSSNSSRKGTSSQPRADSSSATGTSEAAARRCRSIATSGTTPEPAPTSSSGPPSATVQTKSPPRGPRSSISSPRATTSWKKGETSPSSRSSISELDAARVLGRRRDRVAAHRAVAVGCGQPHVDVLPGPEGERPRQAPGRSS